MRIILFFISSLYLINVSAQPDSTKRSKSEALMLSYQLYNQLLNGENMCALAPKYSEDPGSAKNCGEYANIKRGEFIPKFEEILFKLKPGEYSKPFKTEYGYHIVQLISINEKKTYTCRHILITYFRS